MDSQIDAITVALENNERFLYAALAWLRLRLERLAASYPPSNAANSPPLIPDHGLDVQPKRWRLFSCAPARRDHGNQTARAPSDSEIAKAEEAMTRAEEANPAPALPALCEAFNLSRFERNVLLLAASVEFDPYIAVLCARAHDDPQRSYPTFALAMKLFEDPAWEAVSPERPLRYWLMVEIAQGAGQPFMTSPLRADERIVNYLNGISYLDDRLSLLLQPDMISTLVELMPSQQPAAALVIRRIERTRRAPLVQLTGSDSASKQLAARAIATALERQLFVLPAALLPNQSSELETLNRLWQRESVLLPVALYVDASDTQPEGNESHAVLLTQFLTRSGGLVFLDTLETWPGISREWMQVEIARPTPIEQRTLWENVLDDGAEQISSDFFMRLAGQFNLNATTIREIAERVVEHENGDLEAQVWGNCLTATSPRLDVLAQRIVPKAGWDDLVLPDDEKTQLAQIAAQVIQRSRVYDDWGFREKLSRGLGISALFAGPSGTGKTMAAEVLANHLRMNLYRIDLSAVVSKYIGETEKNLRKLFDAAEDGGALLFFDEADALFGKRSEVKDSHDRYANIEINYLLQRIEAYSGLAILATNMKSALDQAFMRRLRFIVNFPFPGMAERREIWRRVFPVNTEGLSRVPLELSDADYDRLARLNLTGGSIHNIVLNAAFMAAANRENTLITLETLFEAARAEFRKLEQPINEADFTLPERILKLETKGAVST